MTTYFWWAVPRFLIDFQYHALVLHLKRPSIRQKQHLPSWDGASFQIWGRRGVATEKHSVWGGICAEPEETTQQRKRVCSIHSQEIHIRFFLKNWAYTFFILFFIFIELYLVITLFYSCLIGWLTWFNKQ